MIPKPISWSLQQSRAKIMAKVLPKEDYDIMLFQEAFSGLARKKIRRGLRETHPYQAALGRGGKLRHILNSGLFLVSRHPFEILETINFESCAKADCFAAKGVILVELTLPNDKKVQIATTHLQAWNTDTTRSVRAQQLVDIKAMFDRNAMPGIPQLLVGDINVDGRKELEYQMALDTLQMSSGLPVGELNYTNGFKVDCYKTPGGEQEGEWLDHVWINPQGGTATVVNRKVKPMMGIIKGQECSLSDHYALEATLIL